MNQKEKIEFLKKELTDLEAQEKFLKESLNLIAIRKTYFEDELVSFGIARSTNKDKFDNAIYEKAKPIRKKTDAQIKRDFMNSIK